MNADTPQGSSMKPEPSSTAPAGPESAEDEATSVLPAAETEDTTVLDTNPEDDTRLFEAKPDSDASVPSDDGDETAVIAAREGDSPPSSESSTSMSEPSGTMGEPSYSESEDSLMPGDSDRPAFSPAATGEIPPDALRHDDSQHHPTTGPHTTPRESASVPQPMSEPSRDTSHPGIKFGLLTWGLLLIIAGVSISLLPWMGQVNWNLVAVLVFGVLGVILLLVAALASFSNRRRANRR